MISVFRLFTAIRLVLTLFGIAVGLSGLRAPVEPVDVGNWIALGETSFLLVFLSWPWFQHKLGRWFLPVALGITTLGPVASGLFWNPGPMPQEVAQARSLMSQWQLVIVLLIPLILVSWRYGFEAAVGFSVAIDFVDLAILTLGNRTFDVHPFIIISILVFRTLFYLLIGYTITRLSQELRNQNSRLETAYRQLARNAIAMEQLAVSRERNRLARELHDTLAHTMSGMAVQLEAVEAIWDTKPDQARGLVKDALQQTRRGLGEARRAIQALRAAPIEDMGLLLALEHLAHNEADRGGLALVLNLPEQIPNLSPEIEHTLYRVAEEALRNAVHHAGAHQVKVSLALQEGRLVMKIQDDGTGFDPSSPAPEDSFGLQGMQERAEAISGLINIESLPGQGTTVSLAVEV